MVVTLVVIGIASGYVEITQSRKEILDLMRIEAESLIDAITLSGENAAIAYGEIETLLEKQRQNPVPSLKRGDAESTASSQSHFEQMLSDYRRRLGVGRLIQDLGSNKEIAYLAIQDEQGIIAASKNVKSLPRISNDPFLTAVSTGDTIASRVTKFSSEEVFEVVTPFTVQGERFGLLRVGLKMDAVNHAIARTGQRAILVGLGFLVVIVVLFNFLIGQQNYQLLTQAHAKIQTYTGNILQSMADAVVAVNRDGRITVFNRAAEKLFGMAPESAIGKRCADILHGEMSLLDKTLETGAGLNDAEVRHRLDGRTITLTVTTSLIHNAVGEIDSAVAVLKDLTEKKALEENLRQREKLSAMGELASGVAHEIRNPLNSISMIAQRFIREFLPVTKQEEYQQLAKAIVVETRRVSDIIQRFLAFARPPMLNLEIADLNEVAERALTLVASEAQQKGVELHRELEFTLPKLALDRNQMEQVFLNLLQNSLHATDAGGEIVLRTYLRDNAIITEVADTGHGISKEHFGKIFDLYFTTKESGTGMGLSIVHRIVSEHGGRIEVESEVENGTRVKLIFPVNVKS